ncbi:MAG TPA: hypothetical protein VJ817_16830 [Gemmatimonadales bacterium]|nr:hypothetical protein [Gemmatimonadales bacterium]
MPLYRLRPAPVVVLLGILLAAPVAARQATPVPAGPAQTGEAIRVFLDCNTFCDFDHIRREITYVNWVRDRTDADVHLIITSQTTGGGREYVLRFIGLRSFQASDDELRFSTQQTDTDDDVRRRQTQRIGLGLTRYAARGALADRLQVSYTAPAGATAGQTQQPKDPWNLWVFEIGMRGYFSAESRQKESHLNGSVEVSRISEKWKFRSEIEARRSHSTFTLEDEQEFKSRTSEYGWEGLLIRSLSRHWSLGLETMAGRSTRENYDLLLKVEPGIEYNLFPYDQSSRRQFVFIYSAGLNYGNYRDSTIFNRLSESRPIHRFTIAGAATQPWGRLESRLVASTYLDDWSKNRISLFGFAEVRIVRGLSLNVYGSYARIRDQLAIPKADIPDEEILLRLRELQTSYRWDFELGLSYTFGSKFSNIVNPRFNQSPGS